MIFLFSKVAILGVGMVGGSLGKALLDRGLTKEVVGFDPSASALAQAEALGAVTHTAATLKEALEGSELIVLAAPVMATLQLLSDIAPLLADNAIVTDVCSTKESVMLKAAEVLPSFTSFVGGHPMAGSEKVGVVALDATLFENAIYVLSSTDSTALRKMKRLVEELGAVPVEFTGDTHDFLVAAVSHLPHLAATALVQTVAGLENRNELLLLAASGFRDTTRVAMGSPQMWHDICLSNRNQIVCMLDKLTEELLVLRCLVAADDAEGLLTYFREAQQFRRMVPAYGKGILPRIYNLFIYVPDRPGIIGEVAGLVGKAGANIAEIELLRVREEEGGPLRFGFMSAKGRKIAADILVADNFRVELQEG